MNTDTKTDKFQQQSWYIIVNQETRGPLSLRDLDVLLRTNQVNSFTYAWKNGMNQWKLMNQIQEIKQSILQSSKEIFEIEKKKEEFLDKNAPTDDKIQGKQINQQDKIQDKTIQNKDQNVMTILEATVDNLLQKTFHQTEDGKWKMYNQETDQWVIQDTEPTQKMQIMKNSLLSKLKNQLFSDQKNNFKRRPAVQRQKEEQKQLTKQQLAKKEKNRKKSKRAAEKKKQKWYQAKVNTFVYISGLPLDITEQQIKEFCAKAGVVRIDLNTGKQKIKIYKDQNGLSKGDAAVSYARQESVEIALEMLSNSQIRSGFKVNVERAQFHQKDQSYIPRQSKKQSKVKKLQAKKLQNKMFGWDQNDQQKGQGLRIVIIKNVFTPEDIMDDNTVQEIKKEITLKLNEIGDVQRIRFYQTHPQGVVQVKYRKQVDAQSCAETMSETIFRGKILQSDYWDGQTDYKHNSVSLLLQQERLNKFANEIENPTQEKNHDQTLLQNQKP